MAEDPRIGHERTLAITTTGSGRVLAKVGAPAGRRCPSCGGDFPADFVVCPRDATPLVAGAEADPLLGAVLASTYRIVRQLAEGGMGRVYEAEHIRLDRRLALKVLHHLYAGDAQGVARFEREAKATAGIASSYLVAVVDLVRTPDGRPCIVSELLQGED